MKFTKCTIVRRLHHPDKIVFEADVPEGTWPYVGPASFTTETAAGNAEEWLADTFSDIPFTVVGDQTKPKTKKEEVMAEYATETEWARKFDEQCDSRSPKLTPATTVFKCTRPRGHEGDHGFTVDGISTAIASWKDAAVYT